MPDVKSGRGTLLPIMLFGITAALVAGVLGRPGRNSRGASEVVSAADDDRSPRKPSVETSKFTPPFEANLLLISVDTTRADHLGCYGYERPTSPRIDTLAATGHLFQAAYTVMPTTLPSHATMFTSLYPAQLGVRWNGARVRSQAYTMAERLSEHGFETAAVVGAVVLHPRLGLKQGFDTYLCPQEGEWPATRVRTLAGKWLRRNQDKRFFCFAHFFDPHTAYNAPRELAAMFAAPHRRLPPERAFITRTGVFTAKLRTETINAYDAEIRYASDEVGRLLGQLSKLGLRERTIVVFVSDHGETLDELFDRYSYAFGHGEFLYRRELRIPFILWLPKDFGFAAPATHTEPVSTLDLLPTLLELLGVPCEPPFEGRSLVPLLMGETLDPRPIISERHALTARQRRRSPLMQGVEFAVTDAQWHWIHSTSRDDELLDIKADPFERENVLARHPETAARLAVVLQAWSETCGASPAEAKEEPVDPEIIRALRSLGYLGGTDDEDQDAEQSEDKEDDE